MTKREPDLATSDTVASDSGPISLEPTPSLERVLQTWGRYRVEKLLGAGGGGLVYRAFDPVLGRAVALKLLRVEDATLAQRLLQEARTQARIDHPNVCKVYETGTVEQHPYVAMQLVDGETLGAAAKHMPVEARVRVLAQVADGIHAAHKLGLIHRDLKPTNVMVERSDDGEWRAYVLDFGLAREMETRGVTVTGAVLGTPAYMAPEQARGDTDLDRRTDVWGLGATMYEVLTGRPPFDGRTVLEVLMNSAVEDPKPLRKHAPSLPLDLETITLTCLVKERARRYQTARAVAEELRRFLDGAPIEARRASALYRLRTWGRRQRVAVALGIVALVGVGAAAGVSWRARRAQAERTRWARELGQAVEQIQSRLREDTLLPLHDTRPARAEVKRRIETLVAQLGDMDEAGRALAHHAIGRARLALHEEDGARVELERAWQDGYRVPDVALALGQACAELYRVAYGELQTLVSKEQRQAREREIDRDLKQPALEYLRRSDGAPGRVAALVEGQIALVDDRLDEAIAQARVAASSMPGSYEPLKLEADAQSRRAYELTLKGDQPGARRALDETLRLFRAATEIGRSDAYLHTAACDAWVQVMDLQRQRSESVEAAAAGVRVSCGAGHLADPGLAPAWALETQAARFAVEDAVDHGRDPRASLEQARLAGRRTLALDPRNTDAMIDLGGAETSFSEWLRGRGDDPSPSFDAAEKLFVRTTELKPGYASGWAFLGLVESQQAAYLAQKGGDLGPKTASAIAHYRKARELVPTYGMAWDNEGSSLITMAEAGMDHGVDPRPALEQALTAYRTGRKVNPASAAAVMGVSAAAIDRAQYELRIGVDPTAAATAALDELKASLDVAPAHPLIHVDRAELELRLGQAAVMAGRDPSEWLAAARASLARAVELDKELVYQFTDGAMVELVEARSNLLRRRPSAAALAHAGRILDGGARAYPKEPQLALLRAMLHRWRAESAKAAGSTFTVDLTAGLAATEATLALKPTEAEAYAVAGALHRLANHPDDAQRALRQALSMNPSLSHEYLR